MMFDICCLDDNEWTVVVIVVVVVKSICCHTTALKCSLKIGADDEMDRMLFFVDVVVIGFFIGFFKLLTLGSRELRTMDQTNMMSVMRPIK
jgi:hypothetical protein